MCNQLGCRQNVIRYFGFATKDTVLVSDLCFGYRTYLGRVQSIIMYI